MQLFDMTNDPGEQNYLSAQNPTDVERLKRLYDELAKDMSR
jgi:hypothetical protein